MVDFTAIRRNVYCFGCKETRSLVYVNVIYKQLCGKCMGEKGLSIIPDMPPEVFEIKKKKIQVALVSAEMAAILKGTEDLEWDLEPLSILSGYRLVAYVDE